MTGLRDLAVIGAGPAGLAAAARAAELGLDTVLIDAQPAPGGQVYRNMEGLAAARPDDLERLGSGYRDGLALARDFRASGADYRPGTAVWTLEADPEPGGVETDAEGGGVSLGLRDDAGASWLRARRAILATGAMERAVPLPGWTLPGVMTVGAAQTLLKVSDLLPEPPVAIAGSGPLLLLYASQLVALGGRIAALLDTTPDNRRRALTHLPGLLRHLPALRQGLGWQRALGTAGVPIFKAVHGVRALGGDALEAVEFVSAGTTRRIETRLLLLHEGVVPDHHLAMAAGCEMRWDDTGWCWHAAADPWGATTVPALAVAGDCAGIQGAEAAPHAGRLAALDAARRLGRIDAAARDRLARPATRARARLAGLRGFLDAWYRPRAEVLSPADPEVVLCRCEEVTVAELRAAVTLGCLGPNQAKAFTRCGMGPCQGRLCGLTAAAVIAQARGRPLAEVGHQKLRPPLVPVTLGELAALDPGQLGNMGHTGDTGPRDHAAREANR